MNYPTIKEIESANLVQLARWHCFLGHPPKSIGAVKGHEITIRIARRLDELGGITPEIDEELELERSKRLLWLMKKNS